MTAEIETVTVSFEEFKESFDHYMRVKETARLVVMHGGEAVAVLGPWLPGEERFISPKWFFDELFGRDPVDMESSLTRAVLEDRGYSFTETLPRSSSSS
jgi:hypothetical protein